MAFDLTCLATLKANFRSASSCAVGCALGHDLQLQVLDHGVVARLHQEAAGQRPERQARRARIGQAAGGQQAQVLLRGEDRLGLVASRPGAITTSVKMPVISRGRRRIDRAVERDDAAEGADGIAAQRLGVGLGQRRAERHAARVGMLDDGDGRRGLGIELRHQLEGRVGVVEVVVGQLLALVLHGRRHARRGARPVT